MFGVNDLQQFNRIAKTKVVQMKRKWLMENDAFDAGERCMMLELCVLEFVDGGSVHFF